MNAEARAFLVAEVIAPALLEELRQAVNASISNSSAVPALFDGGKT